MFPKTCNGHALSPKRHLIDAPGGPVPLQLDLGLRECVLNPGCRAGTALETTPRPSLTKKLP